MSAVAVIDYGMGNLHSITKALQHVSSETEIRVTSDPKIIRRASRVVFPGVGAIGACMDALHSMNLAEAIRDAAKNKPLLGICVGLQALLDYSEEGCHTQCLGVIPGEVVRFSPNLKEQHGGALKIPHMGWNRIRQSSPHALWNNIPQQSRFYFVHSYFAKPCDEKHIIATSEYPDPFACVIGNDNIVAVQFHPEKSQKVGLQFLENFINWDGTSASNPK